MFKFKRWVSRPRPTCVCFCTSFDNQPGLDHAKLAGHTWFASVQRSRRIRADMDVCFCCRRKVAKARRKGSFGNHNFEQPPCTCIEHS